MRRTGGLCTTWSGRVRPPFRAEATAQEFCETLAAYRIKRVQGDRYGGEWPREQFQQARRDLHNKRSGQRRSNSWNCCRSLRRQAHQPARPQAHARPADSGWSGAPGFGTGKDAVGQSPNCHDDIAVAVAGAVLLTLASPGADRRRRWVAKTEDDSS